MGSFRLSIQIYGPLIISWTDGSGLRLAGAKQRGLIALLATAPGHARSRSWLQSQLWSDSDEHQGRANLRQALFQLRRALGSRFDAVIRTEGDVIALIEGMFELTGNPESGEFLEGVDIGEEGFEDWLREMRSAPAVPTSQKDTQPTLVRLQPKLAVLPFREHPPTGPEGFLGDAVAQELIRVLSRSQLIDVVAHLSSRSLNTRDLDNAAVSASLGVDYLVTGRCVSSAGKLVLDVDFQNVGSGSLIWNERFTLTLDKFLAGESTRIHEIAHNIVRSVLSTSVELGVTRPLPSVSSHALLMSAISLMYKMPERTFDRALEQLETVAERAPRHSIPRAWKAQWHSLRIFQGWSDNPRRDRQRAVDEIAAALDLNPECAFSLAMDGNLKTTLDSDFDGAARSFEAALELNPSSPLATQLKSVLSCFLGDAAEAVRLAERARSLSPCDPRRPFFDGLSAAAYLVAAEFEKAIEHADRSLRANPRHISAHRSKVIGLVRLGQMQAASAAVQDLLRRDPKMTVAGYLATHPAGRTPVGQGWAEALAEAGIPKG